MGENDTDRVGESAARALRIALKQEVKRLEDEVARLSARLREITGELEIHRRAEPSLRRSLADLERLSQLSRQINSTLEMDEILKLLVELTAGIVVSEGSIVYLYDDRARAYAKVVTHRLSDEAMRAIQYTLEKGVLRDMAGETRPSIVPEIATAVQSGSQERSLILVPLHQKGVPLGLLVLLSAQPRQSFFEHDLDLLGLLANSLSVAIHNAQLYERARRLSVTDDLTQLANGRYLAEYLETAVARARSTGSKLSMLFTDLDGFKAINDRYGHRMGSAVLVEVAEILRRCTTPGDVIARYGGDEFVAVLPGTEAFKAFLTGDRIRAAVAQHQFLLDHGLSARLTISVGVATFPDHARTVEELIGRSDAAMYTVKNAHKDGVSLSAAARTA